jgi:hypothetical protein
VCLDLDEIFGGFFQPILRLAETQAAIKPMSVAATCRTLADWRANATLVAQQILITNFPLEGAFP